MKVICFATHWKYSEKGSEIGHGKA